MLRTNKIICQNIDADTRILQGPAGPPGPAGSVGPTGPAGSDGNLENINNLYRSLHAHGTNSLIHVVQKSDDSIYVGSAFLGKIPEFEQLFPNNDFIITAAHVILTNLNNLANDLTILLPNKRIINIDGTQNTIIYSINADIAILKIEKTNCDSLIIDDLQNVEIGDLIGIFGWTRGFDEQNCTVCHIKDIGFESTNDVLFTPVDSILCDAVTLASGNSGGPWINIEGKCIGLTSYGYTKRLTVTSAQLQNSINNGTDLNIDTSRLDFSQSFDTLAVSSRSILRLISKYNIQGTPFHYMGNTLSIYHITPLTLILATTPLYNFMTSLVGYVLLTKNNFSYDNRVITEINGKQVGTLNGLSRAGLEIFYADSQVDVKYITGINNNLQSLILNTDTRNINSKLFEFLRLKIRQQ
jgi:S1-C subfamily serine protease